MSDSSYNSDTNELENLDNLVDKFGDITLKDSNFINIKPDVKMENPNVTDVPSSSFQPPTKSEAFNRPIRGYAALANTGKQTEFLNPMEKMKSESINPFGIFLDLDCVGNTEEAIDKWETALRIAVTVNKMDFDTTLGFLEKTLVNSVSRFWKNINDNTKNEIIVGSAKDTSILITRAVEAIRLEFSGEGQYIKDPAVITRYSTALLRLQLCDICEIEKYICVFQDYYYHIFGQVSDTSSYLPLFFAKIPDPWGTKLIETYNPGTLDTLGKRITHVRERLSIWCADAVLAKSSKGLRKKITLCCNNPKMPLMIGCDSSYYYGKIKRKYKKRKYNKKQYFKKRKARYYKRKGYKKTYKPTFKKRNKNPKECRCYYCKEIGHYANNCPKRDEKNQKKIEIDDDIQDMINCGEFVQLNDFNIDSDESIFILTDTEYTSSEESD